MQPQKAAMAAMTNHDHLMQIKSEGFDICLRRGSSPPDFASVSSSRTTFFPRVSGVLREDAGAQSSFTTSTLERGDWTRHRHPCVPDNFQTAPATRVKTSLKMVMHAHCQQQDQDISIVGESKVSKDMSIHKLAIKHEIL